MSSELFEDEHMEAHEGDGWDYAAASTQGEALLQQQEHATLPCLPSHTIKPSAGRAPKRKKRPPLPEHVQQRLQQLMQDRGWGNLPKGFCNDLLQQMQQEGHAGAV
jgi:hypothetical protein